MGHNVKPIKSPCCNAEMGYYRYTGYNSNFKDNLAQIFCTNCLQDLDGNGEPDTKETMQRKPSRYIANLLRSKHPSRYASIVSNLELDKYHDFKSPFACPKILLIQHLQLYPGLEKIVNDVRNGKYDESIND